MRIRVQILTFLLFISTGLLAQNVHTLTIEQLNPLEPNLIFKEINYKNELPNSMLVDRELQEYLLQYYGNGYLAASFDSTVRDSISTTAYLTVGAIYKWARLSSGNSNEAVLSKIGFRDKLYNKKRFNYTEVRKLQEKLIEYYENHGYPFVSVKLDSLEFLSEKDTEYIKARISVTKNTQYKVDSIIIKGGAKIAPVYIYNYLSVKPGDLYNEEIISKISARLKELRFVRETKPVEIAFTDKSVKIYLYLESKKASRFDGMAGFLPNSETTGKLLITGEARLKLLNSFGRGELIAINWKSLQPRTQNLKAQITYPFVLSSPFGADINFTLYKRDTIYLDLITDVGIQYILKRGNYLRAFVKNKETRLLNGYTQQLPYASTNTTLYGLGYNMQKLDYIFNPRRGYSLFVSGGVGNKKIKNDPDLNPDTLEVKSTEYNVTLDLDFYIPIAQRMVINIGVDASGLSSKSMFENELFRIGGMGSLRGFDEESMVASSFVIYTFEYRYLLEQNSYLYLFFNGAYYENEVRRLKNEVWVDVPYGYGAGISFETKAGIFSISYALGQQRHSGVEFSSSKIHFGIINRF